MEVGGAEVTSCIIHRAQSRHIAKKIIFSPYPMIGKPSNLSGSVRSSDEYDFSKIVVTLSSLLAKDIFRCEAKLGVP